MTAITKHIPDAILREYAAGISSPARSLAIDCHLHYCEACAERLRGLLSASPVQNARPTQPEDAELRALLDSAKVSPLQSSDLPDVLCGAINARYGPGHLTKDYPWEKLTANIARLPIMGEPDGEAVYLLNFEPGAKISSHSHRGLEMTQVLRGGFFDATGEYDVGDLQVCGPDIDHEPIGDAQEGCLCLTVRDLPSVPKGPVSKLVQQFFKL